MHFPLCSTPSKLEDYIERCKAIIDQSLDDYHKAWRTGFPRDKYLTRADYYAGRMLKAEERLKELKLKT